MSWWNYGKSKTDNRDGKEIGIKYEYCTQMNKVNEKNNRNKTREKK